MNRDDLIGLLGRPSINPGLFITGKLSSYFVWVSVFIQAGSHNLRWVECPQSTCLLAGFLGFMGLMISGIGLLSLGSSTRMGLPVEDTEFRTGGAYRFSRNPIYLGFNLMTLGSVLFTLNPFVFVFGVYGGIIQHKIILSEEEFLRGKFGREYVDYRMNARRYL